MTPAAMSTTRPTTPAGSPTTATPSSSSPTYLDFPASWPTSYKESLTRITRRRPRWSHGPPAARRQQQQSRKTQTTTTSSSSSSEPRGPSSDPRRQQALDRIAQLRQQAQQVSTNDGDDNNTVLLAKIEYADAMRLFETQFHDGGSLENETIEAYTEIIDLVQAQRAAAHAQGQVTHLAKDARIGRVADEVTLDYSRKSVDGLLCAVYAGLGKTYFMANMFERAKEVYSHCIDDVEADYLDAVNGRASTEIVLGQYAEAGADYLHVIQKDEQHFFPDAFTGIARILETKEEAVPGGWDAVLEILLPLLQQYTEYWQQNQNVADVSQVISSGLKRFHHVLFTYHDRKTKDYAQAWSNLELSHRYKLAALPTWQAGIERLKVQQLSQIFRPGFWPAGVGSDTRTPIFIIGFPRSGSTLLERVLDAHPNIVGTGENSVFNGRLDDIRNQIVDVSVKGQHDQLGPLTKRLAEEVVDEMHRRWERLSANTQGLEEAEPLRLVDKMLTNYYNVGFIHMLYPNALILHVMREPMDTIFSAYKHEFPSGTLEYTSDKQALMEMYQSYRDVIAHWDQVLPGRVTHLRYEDMVHDMPGVAKAIIAATGMPWDESVLDFHKKKHYVNTMSTTQVRQGVYTSGMKSWMRYEKELEPLVKLAGSLVDSSAIVTSLPGYQPPLPGHSEL